jgi:membrane protein DedA with SNARE-associated domain
MDIQGFITTYGYAALFAGILLEGETVLIVAGFLAHRGYLHFPWVVVVAFAGAFLYAEFFFHMGQGGKGMFLKKRPRWRLGIRRVSALLEAYQMLIVIGFRFLYGMRTVTPFVIGISGYSARKFALLNAAGTIVWVLLVGCIGYLFGQLFESILSDIRKYEIYVLCGIVAIGTTVWLIRSRRAKRADA